MPTAIILFSKEPQVGQVKTRLIPQLGADAAYRLYCKLVKLMIYRFAPQKNNNFIIYSDNKNQTPFSYFPSTLRVKRQKGANLGDKMYHALAQQLHYYNKVILFGSDCPFITTAIVDKVKQSLDKYDICFVPAVDGGYVLIAAKKINIKVFEQVDWSTSKVMQQTITQLEKLHYRYKIFEPLNDIDEPEDLALISDKTFI